LDGRTYQLLIHASVSVSATLRLYDLISAAETASLASKLLYQAATSNICSSYNKHFNATPNHLHQDCPFQHCLAPMPSPTWRIIEPRPSFRCHANHTQLVVPAQWCTYLFHVAQGSASEVICDPFVAEAMHKRRSTPKHRERLLLYPHALC
jgi:hypothetical protein